MEYVYAAMLLNAAGKEITEEDMTNVVKAAGLTPDEAKIKSVVSSLKGVDIKSVIENAQTAQVRAAPSAEAAAKAPEKKEEKKEEKTEDEAAGGLAGLFG